MRAIRRLVDSTRRANVENVCEIVVGRTYSATIFAIAFRNPILGARLEQLGCAFSPAS